MSESCPLLLVGVVFVVIGLVILRNLRQVGEFFRGMGAQTFGGRAADRVYTAQNLRLVGIFAIVIGVGAIAVSLVIAPVT